jgi:hypothetical protein
MSNDGLVFNVLISDLAARSTAPNLAASLEVFEDGQNGSHGARVKGATPEKSGEFIKPTHTILR